MLKIKVKVGNITNLSDARYCAGMGVDMLGFPIGGGPLSLDPKKYKEITDWVSVPTFVIEWEGAMAPTDATELLRTYNAHLLEIDVHQLRDISAPETQLVVRLTVSEWDRSAPLLREHKEHIRFVNLFIQGKPDPALIDPIAREFDVLLGGVTLSTVDAASELLVAGIALLGSSETQPGLKEYGELADILEKLEGE